MPGGISRNCAVYLVFVISEILTDIIQGESSVIPRGNLNVIIITAIIK